MTYINVPIYINLFFNLYILSNIFIIRKYTVKCESEQIMFQIHRWKSHYREHKEENGGMKMVSFTLLVQPQKVREIDLKRIEVML